MRIKGKNTDFVHKDDRYHIQTESWAPDEDALISMIFRSGKLVLKKKHQVLGPVADLTEKDVERAHKEVIEEFKELLI